MIISSSHPTLLRLPKRSSSGALLELHFYVFKRDLTSRTPLVYDRTTSTYLAALEHMRSFKDGGVIYVNCLPASYWR